MYPSKECVCGNKLTGVECNVVRRITLLSPILKKWESPRLSSVDEAHCVSK